MRSLNCFHTSRHQIHSRPEYERIHRKTEKREAVREKKAESAAKLEKSIESELLERLKKGTYGDIYNFAPEEFNNVFGKQIESNVSFNLLRSNNNTTHKNT